MCLVKSSILVDSSPALRPSDGLHDRADLDLLAALVPFPDAGAGAVDGERAQLLLARLRAVERLDGAKGILRDGKADQHDDQHEPRGRPENDDVARTAGR